MVKLDSVKLKLPISSVNSYDSSKFNPNTTSTHDGELLKSTLTNSTRIGIGVNSITIDKLSDEVILTMSAKALKDNYIQGISRDTIEQVVRNINNCGVMEFNPERFIHDGLVLSCDVTDNLHITDQNFLRKVSQLPLSSQMYSLTAFNRQNNKGVTIAGKQKSFKERQIIYHKETELLRSPHSKEIRSYIGIPNIQNTFKDIWRVETNFTSFAKAREYCNTTNNKLSSILMSDAKVNLAVFDKITKRCSQTILDLCTEYDGQKWNDIIKQLGYKGLIKDLNYDWTAIETFTRTFNPNNYRRVKSDLLAMYNKLISTDVQINNPNIVTEIKQYLSAI